jgi:heme a synthase
MWANGAGPGLDFAQDRSYIACSMPRFARFAWAVLAYDLAVVAWGAYVRATGSGAGCGAHWPLCNGELVPRSPPVAMLVELSHRVTSGLALVLSVVLFLWALKAYPRDHVVRRGAFASAAFMASEALIGAGLVLFGLVAHDESAKRAVSLCLHLTNTFLLLGSTALTAWWASSESSDGAWAPAAKQGQRAIAWTMGVPLVAMVLVGASGAVTALGDTLYRPTSLAAGLAQDLAPGANVFIRLRAVHPMLAASTGAAILLAANVARTLRPSPAVRVLSYTATALVVAQVAVGLVDVATLAPVPLQLVHLVLADGVWIALVLLTAASLRASPAPAAQAQAALTARP